MEAPRTYVPWKKARAIRLAALQEADAAGNWQKAVAHSKSLFVIYSDLAIDQQRKEEGNATP